ncbi:hypothetical protein [Halorussus halophilus]|uniref:hypothetical protein n=1 Tax=Halorussus halophilus TaxID=2650975 RepID=UPI0013014A5A|nr:hypothetical protein [Halorussus halophilus]
MLVNRSATKLSTVIGALATLGAVVGFSALRFDSTSTVPLFETWSSFAVWTTIFSTLIAPNLLAAIGAFYLTTTDERPVSAVVAGFALGGLLFGAGIVGAHWVVTRPSFGIVREFAWYPVVFVGVAALGALGGDIVGSRLRQSPQ